MELQIDNQRLQTINKGTNFLNLEREKGKRYHIKVMLEVSQTLKEKEETIVIDDNLPLAGSSYWGRRSNGVEGFLGELKKFVKLPLGEVNIPEKSDAYELGLNGIGNKLREEEIDFEDIEITIGELAEQKLKESGIDFVAEIKKILSKQVKENKQQQVDTYIRLKVKIDNLKKLLCKERESYYYSNKPKDETIKMPLTAEEYNSKLKEVETELKKLEKEFGLKESELDYIKIKSEEDEEKGFNEWLSDNEQELRENFDSDNDEGQTFDEYAEMCYSEREDYDED